MKLIDLQAQHKPLAAEISNAMSRVVNSGKYILGEQVSMFESELADYVGSKYAVGFGSGTDALLAACLALDLPQDTTYITTPFSFIASVAPAMWLGWKIRFVDIDPATYNINWGFELPPYPWVYVPVHLYGQTASAWPTAGNNVKGGEVGCIEDAAQALGATYEGKKAGTLGDIGCFSFFPTKNLGAIGDAGACVTDNEDYAKRLKQIRIQGADSKYHHVRKGGNMRLDELQAAVLRVKLPYLDEWNRKRALIALGYETGLVDMTFKEEVIKTPAPRCAGSNHAFHQYTIRVLNGKRDALQAYLKERGIPTAVHYPTCLHHQPVIEQYGFNGWYRNLALADDPSKESHFLEFPEAERASREVLSLPIHEGLTEGDVEQVCEGIRGFYEAQS